MPSQFGKICVLQMHLSNGSSSTNSRTL